MNASLDLRGRTAKVHVDKWQQYGEKAKQHATSAALILIEAKKELSHGKYQPWLDQHGIARSTARQLVLEHKDPTKREARQERDRETKRAVYAAAKTTRSQRFETQPASTPTTPGESRDELSTDQKRERLLAYVRSAARGEVDRLFDMLCA